MDFKLTADFWNGRHFVRQVFTDAATENTSAVDACAYEGQ